mgnify:FL=1
MLTLLQVDDHAIVAASLQVLSFLAKKGVLFRHACIDSLPSTLLSLINGWGGKSAGLSLAALCTVPTDGTPPIEQVRLSQ